MLREELCRHRLFSIYVQSLFKLFANFFKKVSIRLFPFGKSSTNTKQAFLRQYKNVSLSTMISSSCSENIIPSNEVSSESKSPGKVQTASLKPPPIPKENCFITDRKSTRLNSSH